MTCVRRTISVLASLAMLSVSTACAPQPVVVNTISRDCLLFRPVYLSEPTIAALKELRTQMRIFGAHEAAAQVDHEIKSIGDNNVIFETRCPTPSGIVTLPSPPSSGGGASGQ